MPVLPIRRSAFALGLFLLLGGCGGQNDTGPVRVDVIAAPGQFDEPLDNGTNAGGQTLLAATRQGLVAFDAGGALIGGLAERWIVEDDGASYLFRLKRARWSDGSRVKAEEVARLLRARVRAYPQILAGLDPEIRGMTDEVLEIRLPGPSPSFLQLLAHPAMAIARRTGGTGPFRAKTLGDLEKGGVLKLTPLPDPELVVDDAQPAEPAANSLPLYLRPVRAALGFARFSRRQTDLLLGGRFQHLPYVAVAGLPDNAVRADPVNGLFGLVVEGRSDFLANRDVREILGMAIDREQISQRLDLAGWRTETGLLPDELELGRPPTRPGWAERELAIRRGYARSVVTNWTHAHDAPPRLRVALPEGPGARLLFDLLRQNYAAIGLSIELVAWDAPADLRLIDEVAPFDSAIWYLARIGCGMTPVCSEEAAAKLDLARHAGTDADRAAALGEAETLSLTEANYVPLGMPIRFGLVRNRLTGYQPSPRARHPLNALFRDPR